MDIAVSRSRITGTLPFYEYRALVPADAIDSARRALLHMVVAPRVVGCFSCVRIAPLIAPDRYFEMDDVARSCMGTRIGFLAKLVESLIVRTVFPEMTEEKLRSAIRLDHDPGEACVWADIEDLTGAYDWLEPKRGNLTASDLGLRQDCGLSVA